MSENSMARGNADSVDSIDALDINDTHPGNSHSVQQDAINEAEISSVACVGRNEAEELAVVGAAGGTATVSETPFPRQQNTTGLSLDLLPVPDLAISEISTKTVYASNDAADYGSGVQRRDGPGRQPQGRASSAGNLEQESTEQGSQCGAAKTFYRGKRRKHSQYPDDELDVTPRSSKRVRFSEDVSVMIIPARAHSLGPGTPSFGKELKPAAGHSSFTKPCTAWNGLSTTFGSLQELNEILIQANVTSILGCPLNRSPVERNDPEYYFDVLMDRLFMKGYRSIGASRHFILNPMLFSGQNDFFDNVRLYPDIHGVSRLLFETQQDISKVDSASFLAKSLICQPPVTFFYMRIELGPASEEEQQQQQQPVKRVFAKRHPLCGAMVGDSKGIRLGTLLREAVKVVRQDPSPSLDQKIRFELELPFGRDLKMGS